ncbi:Diacylglycerol kinase alpha [Channa argus]|uniref:Diacylglycerol kinase n=1 Tax=Channa argus TaxID=215402 RepID=A0A6G1PI88_CHAAH|nr:Diacylglycerol kinase alpha [Channa argus]
MASSDDTEASPTPVDFIQLQHYMEYSSLRVKDVIKEFHPRGRLAQHSFGEHLDEAGFCLFLKTYLEVDDFPADFCQRLFCYFQHVEKDWTTKSSLPKGVTFKLYDKDGNGLLDSSMIISLRSMTGQVLKDMMTAIDVDESGTVTLEEWLKGGMNNVPLLVLLGLKMTERDGQHIWRMKHFNRPTYCSVCQSMLLGLGKQGLCCTCCKYTVHSQCANKNPEPCARTFVRSKKENGIAVHDWIRSDCNSTKCQVCHKKIKMLAGRRCVWCQEMRHDECIFSGLSSCDCGPLRDHILPPWAIYAVSKEEDTSLLNVTPDGHILQERQLNDLCVISDKENLQVHPPVAVLPLGTGNDLARCLRWGGGYEGSDLTETLKEIEASELVRMDRWSIQVIPEDPREAGDAVPYEIINNYFSVGVDASIAHRFHSMREKHPQRFNSRTKNKLWYFEFATSETLSASCKKLKDCLMVECCGRHLDLSCMSLEGIAVLNIPSMHGGSNLWGESKKSECLPEVEPSEVITDPELLKTISQDISDKRLEVVGLEGVIEMGQIYTGLKSAGHRLAQTSQITIRTTKALPMQIDGEPWMQPPCTIHITHKNQANMLMAPPTKPSGFFHHK